LDVYISGYLDGLDDFADDDCEDMIDLTLEFYYPHGWEQVWAMGWNDGMDKDDLFEGQIIVLYEEELSGISSLKVRLDLPQYWYKHVLSVGFETEADEITIPARI
jgi:hypothetical protein